MRIYRTEKRANFVDKRRLGWMADRRSSIFRLPSKNYSTSKKWTVLRREGKGDTFSYWKIRYFERWRKRMYCQFWFFYLFLFSIKLISKHFRKKTSNCRSFTDECIMTITTVLLCITCFKLQDMHWWAFSFFISKLIFSLIIWTETIKNVRSSSLKFPQVRQRNYCQQKWFFFLVP